MTRRPTASEITDDQLDALYTELDTARSVARGNRRHAEILAAGTARAYAVLDNRTEGETPDHLAARLRAALDAPTA